MPINFNIPKFSFGVPWFMFDIANKQLITSTIIPSSDIQDSKAIILTEQPIPGQNYQPVFSGGLGNRKLSFTLPVVKRNNTVGNILILRQFQNLRERPFGLSLKPQDQFQENPKVLYAYGVGAVPLVYFVAKCDLRHKQGLTNNVGNPQYTEVDFELWLDEANPYNRTDQTFRKLGSLGGAITQTIDVIGGLAGSGRPY